MKFYLALFTLLIFCHQGQSQIGIFTEFDIEATAEVENIEGNIMESRIGLIYGLHPSFRLRAGISRLGRREIGGDFYYKSTYDQIDETFFDQSLNLRHRIISSGNSAFIGLEVLPKRFLIGLDVHLVNRNLERGYIQGFYYSSTGTSTGSFSSSQDEYRFESTYNSMKFFKVNLKMGYSIYQKPRGAVSLYLNYAHDFSENILLEINSVDPELEILNNSIEGGNTNTNGFTFNQFLNSYTNYARDYFSVGINVSYLFNIEVEKPKNLRIGG